MEKRVTQKAKGKTNEAVGSARKGVGAAIGNEKMEAEGSGQKMKGKVQSTTADARNAVRKTADKVKDATR